MEKVFGIRKAVVVGIEREELGSIMWDFTEACSEELGMDLSYLRW